MLEVHRCEQARGFGDDEQCCSCEDAPGGSRVSDRDAHEVGEDVFDGSGGGGGGEGGRGGEAT